MNFFQKSSLITGWIAFAISMLVYVLSAEPSASLWDCAEFISTSYKMEVGHPPGAPLFMMINRFFSMFAPDTSSVAFMVIVASCMASALTIAFMFWTIAHLGRRIMRKSEEELTRGETFAIMGAALIGSLAYAVTDTFWFSAVEGEVYAQSSLFTALVFWAILKWENVADQPHANRWLVLLAYLMGLSIGVHLLNLLAIPAIVFVYYYRMRPAEYAADRKKARRGWWKAFAISVIILAFALYVIIPQTVALGAWFDRIFVNSFGFPVNSGLLTFFLLLLGGLGYGVYLSHRKGKVALNTFLLCTAMMVLGYCTYASVVIRASENPPMNSNAPSDPYQLLSFLNREQYGDRPLFKGQYYSAPAIGLKEGDSYYLDTKSGKYIPYSYVKGYEFDPRFTTIFPRMYSSDPNHIAEYEHWGNITGKKVRYNDEMITIPTFKENLTYFLNYQLNFMYWRYFLWNFVGRQNDLQSQGELTKGNWLSGIKPIDEIYLGPQDNLPSELKDNKGRNRYYFLPFILGMIGLFYQLRRDRNNFTVVMWLFFMTGIAIILYLNQPPLQPRERDYAFAGSFYAFSIWIGLGVLWFYDLFYKYLGKKKEGEESGKGLKMQTNAAILATVICSCVPLILISENWDDHTRANRYIARDYGANYLKSTLPNSIIIPYGDNDTFPLWYNQEVEGVRPDVKIMNLSYMLGDWYVNQMTEKTNDAEPVPFSLPKEKYYKTNEYIPILEIFSEPMAIKDVINFIKNDSPTKQNIAARYDNQFTDFIPGRKIAIPVNKENALKSGIVKPEDADKMVDTIYLTLNGSGVTRAQYMILDMIATSDWTRPIYVTQAGSLDNFEGFKDYLQLDGIAYRFVPIRTPNASVFSVGRIDTEYLYNKLMNEFKYGNVKDPSVNADYFVQYTINATQIRNAFARLAKQLVQEGDTVRAKEVLNKVLEELPFSQVRHSYNTFPLIEALYMAGETDKANEILTDYYALLAEYMDYFKQFKGRKAAAIKSEAQEKDYYMQLLAQIAYENGQLEDEVVGEEEEEIEVPASDNGNTK